MGTGILRELQAPDYTVRVTRYSPHRQMAPHAHDEHGISIVVDGSFVEEAEHRAVTVTAGWCVTKPRGVFHENRFGNRGATILAIIPRGDLADAVPPRWQWLESAATFQAALRFVRCQAAGPYGPGVDRMIDLLATLEAGKACSRSPWLRRVKQCLDDQNAPSVSQLAADAGVHPVYLARAFRAAFGVSIREYRQIHRVRRALRSIVETSLPLAQVALDCGFSDHSHMCRSFRVVAGWNPAVLRG